MRASQPRFFADVTDDDDLCQGDVVHALGSDGQVARIAMIVTADCDIAQNKSGNEITLLQIVSADNYIRKTWAPLEIDRITKRQIETCLPELNAAIVKRDATLSELTGEMLVDWLASSMPEQILLAAGVPSASRHKLQQSLECLRTALHLTSDLDDWDTLKRMWTVLGTPSKSIKARIGDILHSGRGPGDVYFLPYLPDLNDIGYVIRLRRFESVERSSIYRSRTDARIGNSPGAYYRTSRLRDGIRFSVVQRMAILFSRIGLPEEFEDETGLASEMIVSSIHSEICEGEK